MYETLTPTEIETEGTSFATESKCSARGSNSGGLDLFGIFRNIGSEELLLIGLIILLVTQNADMELILVIAFLLLCDM